MLPDGFPGKKALEDEGYETVESVKEATDEELLAIDGVAEGTLAKIRDIAPYTPASTEQGTGEVSGESAIVSEPVKQKLPTGEDLPEGITKNERGTFTASSTVDQDDMFHPDRVKSERETRLRRLSEQVQAALGK